MTDKDIEKKTTWRNWLIKKLLSNENSKEDILSFIAKNESEEKNLKTEVFEDNNEENLIKNIINLNKKNS